MIGLGEIIIILAIVTSMFLALAVPLSLVLVAKRKAQRQLEEQKPSDEIDSNQTW